MTTTHVPLTTDDGLTLAATWHRGGTDDTRPVVVAVHGYPDDAQVWDRLVPHLLPHSDVLTYDVRGSGDSEAPSNRAGYRLEHLAADLDTVVRHARDGDRAVHVVAHDWGSIQAWHAVTGDGDASRVRSFTSLSGPCLDHVARWVRESAHGSRAQRTQALRQALASAYIAFFMTPMLPEASIRTGILPFVLAHTGDGAQQRDAGRHRPSRRSLLSGLELYRANMLRRDEPPAAARTTAVPTLVVVATHDRYVRAPMATCAASYVPGLRTARIDAGHWSIVTHPQSVADLVRSQLDR